MQKAGHPGIAVSRAAWPPGRAQSGASHGRPMGQPPRGLWHLAVSAAHLAVSAALDAVRAKVLPLAKLGRCLGQALVIDAATGDAYGRIGDDDIVRRGAGSGFRR